MYRKVEVRNGPKLCTRQHQSSLGDCALEESRMGSWKPGESSILLMQVISLWSSSFLISEVRGLKSPVGIYLMPTLG